VSQLGVAVAERSFGAPLPDRIGNRDAGFALQGVFAARGDDRWVAISATSTQLDELARALGIDAADESAIAAAIAESEADDAASGLQAAGIAAAVVADAADQLTDPHLWSRGFFGVIERTLPGIEGEYPHGGPAWGGGPGVPLVEPRPVGADSRRVLRDVAGLNAPEIDALYESGVSGEISPPKSGRSEPADMARLAIERGELTRVDPDHDGWTTVRARAGR
jgi:benzylsuccinate CoA-transferase BbsF subunit